MDTDDLRIRSWGEIGAGYLGPAFHARFRPGHVLYGSRRTYLRKVALADFDGVCANTTFVLESADPSVLLPALLPFVMQTDGFHAHSKRESKGSVNPYVNFSDLAWYEFTLPSMEDQVRLTSLLTAATATVNAARAARDEAERLRRSYLVSLFRPARGSRDVFPAHWEVLAVREAGDVQLGQQRHPSFESGSNVRPYLRVANVMDGWLDVSNVLSMHFPRDAMSKFQLRAGDILLNEGQSIELVGRSCIYRGEITGACFQKTLIRFRCGPRLLPEFVQAFFQHMLYSGQFAKVAVQTTSIAHLTAVRFAQLLLPAPPLDEQRRILEELRRQERARDVIDVHEREIKSLTRKAVNMLGIVRDVH